MRAPNRLGTSFDVEFGENVFHVRLRRDIDFEVIDDQPVDVVFLLLLSESADDEQLNALACAARAMRDPETLKRVRAVSDREALFRVIADSGTA
jgi:nitrogen PTS system EIIA component